MGGIMKQKKRKDDTGLYMRQWNMELRETISRNMVAYENKVRECKELKKKNKDLKMLCSRLEREHDTVYQEWKAVIEEYKILQNNRDKAIEYINKNIAIYHKQLPLIAIDYEEVINILGDKSD